MTLDWLVAGRGSWSRPGGGSAARDPPYLCACLVGRVARSGPGDPTGTGYQLPASPASHPYTGRRCQRSKGLREHR